jgi:hypothetical protein
VRSLSKHETSMRVALIAAESLIVAAQPEAELQAIQATD